jgi:hypothetical protein
MRRLAVLVKLMGNYKALSKIHHDRKLRRYWPDTRCRERRAAAEAHAAMPAGVLSYPWPTLEHMFDTPRLDMP